MADEFKDFEKVPTLVFGEEPKAETTTAEQEAVQGTETSAAEPAIVQSAQTPTAEPVASQNAESAPAQNSTVPSSHFAAAAAAAVATDIAAKTEEVEEAKPLDDSSLSEEEREQVAAFSQKIDLRNTTAILQYGAGAQKKMADFSEKALENVKTKDLGEVGDMISGLVTELRSFDVTEDEKGFLGLFKKTSNKATAMKAKYDKASSNIDKICETLEDHQVQLIKDIATLDNMYELNLTYFKELTMYILAGKKRLEEVRNGELRELNEKAKVSGLAEDAQAAKDLDELCERFEKKIYDLELTRTVALQTAPQIRLVQDSDEVMVEKIQSTLVNTIPLWKNQMVIAMGVEHSNQAAKAQREVTEMTNELLKKNAEKLKTATIETAKEAERGIVDMETLKHTNETLISTLDEVVRIQNEGKAKRQAAELEMSRMETQLKNKLLEMSAS